MAEDAFQNLPYPAGSKSVFQAGWPTAADSPAHLPEVWDFVRSLRDDVNACMEKARVDKVVGANLDAEVFVHVPADKRQMLAALVHDGNHLASPRPADFNGVDDLRFLQPVNHGNSLKVRLTCKQKTLRGDTGYGEVRWDAEVTNQDDEICAQYDVLTMVATDAHWRTVS